MVKQLTHAVKDFRFFFANLCPPDLTDNDKLQLVKAHFQAHHLSVQELGTLSTLFRNPDILFQGDLGPTDRDFVSKDFYVKTPLYSAGIIRVKDQPSGSYVQQVVANFGGLFDVQWQEEYGIAPLTQDTFICRTAQPMLIGTAKVPVPGVSPHTVLLIPTTLVWDLLQKTDKFPAIFGGWTFLCQAKQAEIPPEVRMTVPEVKFAFRLCSYKAPGSYAR